MSNVDLRGLIWIGYDIFPPALNAFVSGGRRRCIFPRSKDGIRCMFDVMFNELATGMALDFDCFEKPNQRSGSRSKTDEFGLLAGR